jgi:hypothetical protein
VSGAALGRPAAAAPLGNLLRLLALPLLGFLVFGVGIGVGIPSNRIALLGMAVATGTLVLSPIVLDSVRPRARRHLLLSIVSLAYLVHFVFPAFISYVGTSGYAPETFAHLRGITPDDIAWGLFMAFVAYAALLVGYVLPVGRAAARALPRMEREWSHEATLAVALLMIPIGWTVFLAGQFGLIPKRAGSGALGTLASATNFGLALLAIAHLRHRSKPALFLLGLFIPPTMAFNFFTGSKQLFLMPLAMVATAHIIVTRRLRMWWIVGFLAAITLLYPLSQVYREYLFGRRLSAVQVIASPHYVFGMMRRFIDTTRFGDYLAQGLVATSNRLDALAITAGIARDAGTRVPFQHGWSLGYIAISYVPRFVWPDKPLTTIGGWVTAHYGSGPWIESATGPSWVGEFYFNFGWAGVLVGMGLLGVWFRWLQEAFLGVNATIPALFAGVIALFAVAPAIQGAVIAPINGVVYNVTPIVLVHLCVRTFSRPPPPLPPLAT